ncbi:hypothetical protein [Halorarum salinum]|uniref:Uncharacterized protein n=1 Tax=Halorarum salinum TaxID=2743089 RepID=A0A7D5L7Y3_9EURY|nr:hypothetical protein [Halobaculum salinum]QLG60233.1 hypothetical protein HUG12_07410 [Halobaculum salinum]
MSDEAVEDARATREAGGTDEAGPLRATGSTGDVDARGGTGETSEAEAEGERSHLDEVPSGAGCTEIWEKLSEQREAADDDE